MKRNFLQNSLDNYRKDLKEAVVGMNKAKEQGLPTLYRTYSSRVNNLTAIINNLEKMQKNAK